MVSRKFAILDLFKDLENFFRLNAIADPIIVINKANENCDAPMAIPIHIARSKKDKL